MKIQTTEKIAFGGGCHWCTEAVFQTIRGVNRVEQGFISSYLPHIEFSEGVIVHFDPGIIKISLLIQIHLQTHSSSSVHSMRNKYRSAIYTFSQNQEKTCLEIMETLRKESSSREIITNVLAFRKFKPSEEHFRDYYLSDPEKPFCRTYISPKLNFLNENYAEHMKK